MISFQAKCFYSFLMNERQVTEKSSFCVYSRIFESLGKKISMDLIKSAMAQSHDSSVIKTTRTKRFSSIFASSEVYSLPVFLLTATSFRLPDQRNLKGHTAHGGRRRNVYLHRERLDVIVFNSTSSKDTRSSPCNQNRRRA